MPKETIPSAYPCLMKADDTDLEVLFVAPGKGTVVKTDRPELGDYYLNAVGKYSEGWLMKYFKPKV